MRWKSDSVCWRSELELPIITEKQQKTWMVKTALFIVISCAASALAQEKPAAAQKAPSATAQEPGFAEKENISGFSPGLTGQNFMPSIPPGYNQVIKDLTTIIEKQQNLINKLEARIKELEKGSEPKP